MRTLNNNRGIALVAIIMMMMILLTISTAGLLMSAVNLKTTSNYKTGTMAFNVADAGINNGWMALGNVFDTLHYENGPTTLLTDTSFNYGGNAGTYTVQAVELTGVSGPKQAMITSTGCFPAATYPCSSVSKAVIEARFKAGAYAFNNAIESAGETNINDDTDITGGSKVDSFDSRNGNYNTCLNPPSCTQLNTGAEGDIRSNQDITLAGSNTVVSGNATSHGTINATGGATITGTPTPSAPQKDYAPVTPCGPPWSTLTGITNAGGGNLTLSDGDLNIQAHADVHFAAGTYCFKSVTVSGNSTMTVDGAVKLYLTDYSDLSGGTVSNYSCTSPETNSVCDAEKFQIFSSVNSESQGVKVAGGSQTAMTIYAPQGRVQITGGSDFLGAVVGVKVDVTGGTKFHYDKKLKNPNGSPLQLISWRQVF